MLKQFLPFVEYILERRRKKEERVFSARNRAVSDTSLSDETKEHIEYLRKTDLIYQATGRRFTEQQIKLIELARKASNNRLQPEFLYSVYDKLVPDDREGVRAKYGIQEKISYFFARIFSDVSMLIALGLWVVAFFGSWLHFISVPDAITSMIFGLILFLLALMSFSSNLPAIRLRHVYKVLSEAGKDNIENTGT